MKYAPGDILRHNNSSMIIYVEEIIYYNLTYRVYILTHEGYYRVFDFESINNRCELVTSILTGEYEV